MRERMIAMHERELSKWRAVRDDMDKPWMLEAETCRIILTDAIRAIARNEEALVKLGEWPFPRLTNG